MRIPTVVASALALVILTTSSSGILAPVSAQFIISTKDCMTCVEVSALAQDASCDIEALGPFGYIAPGDFEKLTLPQKRCNCILSVRDDWARSCMVQKTCTDDGDAEYIRKAVSNIRQVGDCMPYLDSADKALWVNATATATVSAPVAAAPTISATPTGHNGGAHLSSSYSKLLAGAALAIGSTIVFF